MTTWYLIFERPKGAAIWTLTHKGDRGGVYITQFPSERSAMNVKQVRDDDATDGFETRVVKVEIPND